MWSAPDKARWPPLRDECGEPRRHLRGDVAAASEMILALARRTLPQPFASESAVTPPPDAESAAVAEREPLTLRELTAYSGVSLRAGSAPG